MTKDDLDLLFEQARLNIYPGTNPYDAYKSMYHLLEGFYKYLEGKQNEYLD